MPFQIVWCEYIDHAIASGTSEQHEYISARVAPCRKTVGTISYRSYRYSSSIANEPDVEEVTYELVSGKVEEVVYCGHALSFHKVVGGCIYFQEYIAEEGETDACQQTFVVAIGKQGFVVKQQEYNRKQHAFVLGPDAAAQERTNYRGYPFVSGNILLAYNGTEEEESQWLIGILSRSESDVSIVEDKYDKCEGGYCEVSGIKGEENGDRNNQRKDETNCKRYDYCVAADKSPYKCNNG